MPDPQIITAYAAAAAVVLGAVTGLLAELRRWRTGKNDNPTDPPGNP